MNFSIHLPDPLLDRLDAFARSQQASRSSIIREAVQDYLARQALETWPADLDNWMRGPAVQEQGPGPDFEAIRSEMNRNMRKRVARLPKS